jgi:flagellin
MSRINSLSGLSSSQLKSLRRLTEISKAMDESTTRLSTMKRINSAKDDPAGIVKVSLLQSHIADSQKASDNVSRANNMLDVAYGAGNEILGQLQEARSLAIEAASGTLSSSEISANQLQIDTILKSINSQASVSYNNQKLLDGSAGYTASGYNSAQIKDVDILSKTGSGTLSVDVNVTTTAQQATDSYAGGALAGDVKLTVGGPEGSTTISLATGATTQDITDAFNAVSYLTGVKATRVDATNIDFNTTDYGSSSKMSITALEGTFATTKGGSAEGRDAIATINGNTYTADGTNFSVYSSEASFNFDIAPTATGALTSFNISGDGLEFKIGGAHTSKARIGLQNYSTYALGGSLGSLDTIGGTGENSLVNGDPLDTISVIDSAIDDVTSGLAVLGSFQKYTLDSTSRVLDAQMTSMSKALSDLQDTDVAYETSRLTNNQLLQQTTIEALSIANDNQNNVLTLLQRASLNF